MKKEIFLILFLFVTTKFCLASQSLLYEAFHQDDLAKLILSNSSDKKKIFGYLDLHSLLNLRSSDRFLFRVSSSKSNIPKNLFSLLSFEGKVLKNYDIPLEEKKNHIQTLKKLKRKRIELELCTGAEDKLKKKIQNLFQQSLGDLDFMLKYEGQQSIYLAVQHDVYETYYLDGNFGETLGAYWEEKDANEAINTYLAYPSSRSVFEIEVYLDLEKNIIFSTKDPFFLNSLKQNLEQEDLKKKLGRKKISSIHNEG